MNKKFVSILLSAAVAVTCLAGCGKKTSYKQLNDEDDTVYTIGISHSSASENDDFREGFNDAIEDTFGKNHYKFVETTCSSIEDTASVQSLIDKGAQLIVTEDWKSLSASYTLTQQATDDKDKTPIVSTGVNDIAATLGIEYQDEDNKTTGVNVTGVTPSPDVSSKLSELIETVKTPERVGIIYSPENRDAVKENRTLEEYLTQAGIGYREYILPTSTYKTLMKDETEAEAIKQSDDIDPTVPQISDDFAKSLFQIANDSVILNWEKRARQSLKNASSEKIIRTAIQQCNALYISTGYSESTVKKITRAAKNADLVTFGSDNTAGRYSLITLWADPYDSGYKAGELVYQVLVNGQDPGDIPVTTQSEDSFHKLYNGSYAEVLGLTFPKSFSEYTSFMSSYVPGEGTEKVGDEEED
ncbi:MAG: ABC transporter substrate binding protein [Candidatus Weimeria sp.]